MNVFLIFFAISIMAMVLIQMVATPIIWFLMWLFPKHEKAIALCGVGITLTIWFYYIVTLLIDMVRYA